MAGSTIMAVTTCNAVQWLAHGKAMVDSFDRFWPEQVGLLVYAEGLSPERRPRVTFIDLDAAAPWLKPWKSERTDAQRGITPKGYRYRWDAVRFAHKIAALDAAATACDCGLLVWIDSDVMTHAAIASEWLEGLLPQDADLGWLDRARMYPETGFMLFRLPETRVLIQRLADLYATGAIFGLPEWHDAVVIQHAVNEAVAGGEVMVASLSGRGREHHNVFANSPLAERLDHLKGARKANGRTPPHERVVDGGGKYWRR
jgi:hypothetical protein